MPVWNVYHPVDAYTAQDKREFAAAVTGQYTNVGLPAFYVVVLFHAVDAESFFVGGEPAGDAVRICIDHIARHVDDPDHRRALCERYDEILAPFTRDRGLYWEFHIDETAFDLWRIAGQSPPDPGSDAEKLWARENRPVPL